MKKLLLVSLVLAGCDAKAGDAGKEGAEPADKAASGVPLAKRLVDAYTAGADWLVSQQTESGAWKLGPEGRQAESPSSTAIIVTALAGAPKEIREKYADAVDKGVAYLVKSANDDGSFGEGPTGGFLKTYATALGLMALSTADADQHAQLIRGAQAFLKQHQMKEEGVHRGGMGYGDEAQKGGKVVSKDYANLAATGWTAESMKVSGLPQDDEFWKLVIEYVRKCQNNSEVNKDATFLKQLEEQGLSVGDDGGLFYMVSADRSKHKAGTKKIADKETIQSYGSMTYDGIKTYIYAGLPKDSPEVRSAVDWVRKNYSVEAHPGFKFDDVQRHHLRGIYYYYLVMARALDAYGENPFETFDGKKHHWPAELGEQLLKVVRDSNTWKNDNPAWYEGDPVLTTSYVLNTLNVILKYAS